MNGLFRWIEALQPCRQPLIGSEDFEPTVNNKFLMRTTEQLQQRSQAECVQDIDVVGRPAQRFNTP